MVYGYTRRSNIVHGNVITPTPAILAIIPFRKGDLFEEYKTRSTILNLYKELKRFRNITIRKEPLSEQEIVLHLSVEEKFPLKQVVFKGNKGISEKNI